MESTVLPWIKTVAGDRHWVWPQDPAPCHVSNKSIKWLKDHCYNLVSKDCWPHSSPDLYPLDYFVWGYLETHTNRRAHTTKASLITSIKENFASVDKAMVAKDCMAF
jgi:inhibitor of nuclear factor kappa-B kinase subunit alpha